MSADSIQSKKPASRPVTASSIGSAPGGAAPPDAPVSSLAAPASGLHSDQFVGARPPAQRPPSSSLPSPRLARSEGRAASRNAASVTGGELQDAVKRGANAEIIAVLDKIAHGKVDPSQSAELLDILRARNRSTPEGKKLFDSISRAYGIDLGAVVKELEKDDVFDKVLNDNSKIPRDGLEQLADHDDVNDQVLRKAVLKGLYKSAVDGSNPDGFPRILGATKDRAPLARMFEKMLDNDSSLRSFIESDPKRLRRAQDLAKNLAPTDPSIDENRKVNEAVANFQDWGKYPHHLIVVPGYTPLNAKSPIKMHPTQKERLEQAVRDYHAGQAPFIMVSGGNVHPPGTDVNEALSMKEELKRMGIPEDRIIVDARAQHSTTNLRNVGRYMLDHGMTRALVTTSFDQDFYFSCPDISDFHNRCRRNLGYTVGELEDVGNADPNHSVFTPSKDVHRINYKDPRDP